MDYVKNGDVYKYLQKKRKLKLKQVKHLMFQLASALAYIHSKGIMHRDLKLENLLLDEGNWLKLCDFGWCTDQGSMRKTFCGTYEYMAPELVLNMHYSNKVDIWALGILTYELLHGYSPFKGYGSKAILRNIKKGVFNFGSFVEPEARWFISSCLWNDPSERPPASDLLNGAFFDEIRDYYAQKQSRASFRSLNTSSSFIDNGVIGSSESSDYGPDMTLIMDETMGDMDITLHDEFEFFDFFE